MLLKKTTCLLLTLIFICTVAVPVVADSDPPPPAGEGNIHPWDNNDDFDYRGGPLQLQRRPWLFGYGFNGRLVMLPLWSVTVRTKSERTSGKTGFGEKSGDVTAVIRNR
jgi:hypothetical protein